MVRQQEDLDRRERVEMERREGGLEEEVRGIGTNKKRKEKKKGKEEGNEGGDEGKERRGRKGLWGRKARGRRRWKERGC